MESFQWLENGFSSVVGTVKDNLYIGRTAAGGRGKGIDINGDGKLDVKFSQECNFILQLEKGKVQKVEVDRKTRMYYKEKEFTINPHQPLTIE